MPAMFRTAEGVVTSHAGAALLCLLSMAGACADSPTAPLPHVAALSVGDTVRGTLQSGNEADAYVVTGQVGDEVSVLVAVTVGGVAVDLADSAEGRPLASVHALAGEDTSAGTQHSSGVVTLPVTGQYRLRVQRWGGAPAAEYVVALARTNRAPERVSAILAIGDTLDGEALEHAGDIDEFLVRVPEARLVTLFATKPAGHGTAVDAVVLDEEAGALLGAVTTGVEGQALGARSSGRFLLRPGRTVRIRVRAGTLVGAFPAPYKLQLFPIDSQPERVAAQLILNDTIRGEAIEPLGDIDDYVFEGPRGQQVNVFFQAQSGTASDSLLAVLMDASGRVLAGPVRSVGTDTALTRQASGRVTLPADGTYRIRVLGQRDTTGGDLGAYRLRVYGVEEAPESAGSALVPGGVITSERIELPGDVDTYVVTVLAEARIDVELRGRSVDSADSLRAELFDRSGAARASVTVAPSGARGSGVVTLAAGTYALRVAGTRSTGDGFRGAYEIVLHAIAGSTPELASAQLPLDDTVSDALEPLGDEDVFTVTANKREHYRLHLQGLGAPGGYLDAVLRDAATKQTIGTVSSQTAEPSLAERRSVRLTLPATATYEVAVTPRSQGRDVADRGPYRLALLHVPMAPEHVPTALTIGDSVFGEGLEDPNDMDRFIVSGDPGREVVVYYQGPGSACTSLDAVDPVSGDSLQHVTSCGFSQSTGRFRLPGSGTAALEVYVPLFCDPWAGCSDPGYGQGPYELRVLPINRAPEVASAAIAYGDTVSGSWDGTTLAGEWIKPDADVDEFTFMGARGDTVEVLFQTPNGTWSFAGIQIELINPRSDAVLGTTSSYNPESLEAHRIGPVVLPEDGEYLIRVEAVSGGGGSLTLGAGPYRFVLRRLAGPV